LELSAFNAHEYLSDAETLAAYITLVISEGDADAFIAALCSVARAKSISCDSYRPCETTDTPEKLGSLLRVDSILQLCAAMGIRLVAIPIIAKNQKGNTD